jgi:hypothetical protein
MRSALMTTKSFVSCSLMVRSASAVPMTCGSVSTFTRTFPLAAMNLRVTALILSACSSRQSTMISVNPLCSKSSSWNDMIGRLFTGSSAGGMSSERGKSVAPSSAAITTHWNSAIVTGGVGLRECACFLVC